MMWQPYGGPPEEDSMVRFGMGQPRLLERFSQIIVTASREVPLTEPQQILVSRALALLADIGLGATDPANQSTLFTAESLGVPGQRVLRNGVWHWPTVQQHQSRIDGLRRIADDRTCAYLESRNTR
jgi:hypothetical protein